MTALGSLDESLALCDDNPVDRRPLGLTLAVRDLLDAAARAGTPVVVCGGLARNVYVRPRMTDDADFLVEDMTALERVASAAAARFHLPEQLEPVTRLNHIRVRAKVDLIAAEYPFEREALALALEFPLRGRAARVIPAAHLAAMKTDVAADPNRPEDYVDVLRLILSGAADPKEVEALVVRDLPGCVDTLHAILRSVERAKAAPPRARHGRQ